MQKLLQPNNTRDTIGTITADPTPPNQQLIKFMRRIMALADGRHEIIVTVANGVQDWTVRPIGKVEK